MSFIPISVWADRATWVGSIDNGLFEVVVVADLERQRRLYSHESPTVAVSSVGHETFKDLRRPCDSASNVRVSDMLWRIWRRRHLAYGRQHSSGQRYGERFVPPGYGAF